MIRRYLRLAYEWIRLMLCRFFNMHADLILGSEVLRRTANVLSPSRPTLIARFMQVRTVYFCKWCGRPHETVAWFNVRESDPSPRAPGESGISKHPYIGYQGPGLERRVFGDHVEFAPRTDRVKFRS